MHNWKKGLLWVLSGLLFSSVIAVIHWHYLGRDWSACLLLPVAPDFYRNVDISVQRPGGSPRCCYGVAQSVLPVESKNQDP